MTLAPPLEAHLGRAAAPRGAPRPLDEIIQHAAHFLPAQGPINVFIHHNTLHAFEHLPFDEGVQQGGRLFGCQPYLAEDRYREHLASGRIRPEDLSAALLEDLGDRGDELLGFMGTRFHFRLAMLRYPLRLAPTPELRWFIAQTDALMKFRTAAPPEVRQRYLRETRRWALRDLGPHAGAASGEAPDKRHQSLQLALAAVLAQCGAASMQRWSDATWETFALQALWRVCRDGVRGVDLPPLHRPRGVRHRDWLLEATGQDSDLLVHELLIPLCAAFLDQGLAHWPLPEREHGLWHSFYALYGESRSSADAWRGPLAEELARINSQGLAPLASIQESLDLLGVADEHREQYLTSTLLALRGWAGMMWQIETRGDRAVHPIPPGSLVELLAVRLILDRLALAWLAKESIGFRGPLSGLHDALPVSGRQHDASGVEQRAFLVFQLAQVLGWQPAELHRLSPREWTTLVREIEAFPAVKRRQVFHAAFERRYRVQVLDALSSTAASEKRPADRPRFQVVCCLDEREESFRRHLEELSPELETFGAAGFFNVAMYYRGTADAHYVPLCPIVIRPQHWVRETVPEHCGREHQRRAVARRALGRLWHRLHLDSRSFAVGAVLAGGLGARSTAPLVGRGVVPRLTARIRRLAEGLVRPPEETDLKMDCSSVAETGEPPLGFTETEMAEIGERLLRDIGLTRGMAPLVAIVGHQSSSLNNPHNSAYNCGACGGNSGGPNARAAARILNNPRIRAILKQRGLAIGDDTLFVGACHNTCSDEVVYYDLAAIAPSQRAEVDALQNLVAAACSRNAHERCRRFLSAPLDLSFAAAKRHVESRSEDLAQTRPECGHATNAVCVVGRRSRTRGLFMDRRAFLTSYDPTQDDAEHSILTRILQAVFPVCAGINLEYYFSYVDPTGYGCGTKLPHNVTSLLGVMDGAASDLRTGLPWQMVEIHEPVRLLFVVETTPEAMLRIIERNEAIGRLCGNGWVQLATLCPDSGKLHHFHGGRFEPYACQAASLPHASSSSEWYRGWRDHLGFAVIEPTAAQEGARRDGR